MSNQFTDRAQRVVLIAQEEAKGLNHDYVGGEHLLLALMAIGEGAASTVLANLNVSAKKVSEYIVKVIGTGDNVMLLGEIPFTPRAKKVLEYACEEAAVLSSSYVGTEHLLLGLLREEEGLAARALEFCGLQLEVVREEVLNLLAQPPRASVAGGPRPVSAASGMPEYELNRVARLLYVLMRDVVPVGVVDHAVAEALEMAPVYDKEPNAMYTLALDMAGTLLDK